MAALTDAQILAALPVESQRKIDSAFEALSQSLPTDKERIILYRVAHTLKLNPTDTHFSVMAALHYYLQLYQTIPNLIVRAGGEVVEAGKSVDAAIRKATKEAITEHKQALENQAKLVSFDSQKTLIEMVGKTAQKIAGDSAAAERANSISRATNWAIFAVLSCAVIFCMTGYLLRMGVDSVYVGAAQDKVIEANDRSDSAIAAAQKKAALEIEAARLSAGWAGTEKGRLAKKFFEEGDGFIAAKCGGPTWDIVVNEKGTFCVPQMRDFPGFGDGKKYGWKIP